MWMRCAVLGVAPPIQARINKFCGAKNSFRYIINAFMSWTTGGNDDMEIALILRVSKICRTSSLRTNEDVQQRRRVEKIKRVRK